MLGENARSQCRLVTDVMDRGLCVRCGACVGLCPYFNYFDGTVVVMDPCPVENGKCIQVCPRAEITGSSLLDGETSAESSMGAYHRVFMARSRDPIIRERSQYGGVVSTLVLLSLREGMVQSAVLTDQGAAIAPQGRSVSTEEQVFSCRGSRYSASGSLAALNLALKQGEGRMAFVGLPCQMEALARMRGIQGNGTDRYKPLVLRIGLFCTWALDYRELAGFLKQKGIPLPIKKYDIPPPPAQVFQVLTQEGWIEFPLSEIRPLVQKGCGLCQDMTALWADISVGAVEGLEGWNTVLVRTESGELLIQRALEKGRLEMGDLPEENFIHLKEASRNKWNRGKKARIQGT